MSPSAQFGHSLNTVDIYQKKTRYIDREREACRRAASPAIKKEGRVNRDDACGRLSGFKCGLNWQVPIKFLHAEMLRR